jgi:hypothetical protein
MYIKNAYMDKKGKNGKIFYNPSAISTKNHNRRSGGFL